MRVTVSHRLTPTWRTIESSWSAVEHRKDGITELVRRLRMRWCSWITTLPLPNPKWRLWRRLLFLFRFIGGFKSAICVTESIAVGIGIGIEEGDITHSTIQLCNSLTHPSRPTQPTLVSPTYFTHTPSLLKYK